MSDVILNKVKKLLALSKSPNESEASSALDKAHALLRQYNLELSDIKEENKYGIVEDVVIESKNDSKWRSILLHGIAEANFCKSLKVEDFKKTTRKFVGKSHNIIVAKEMYVYLEHVVERLSKKFSGSERGSYKLGISMTLMRRLLALKEKDQVECTALVVQEESMINDYFKNKGVKSKAMSIRTSNNEAYGRGIQEGHNVSLNGQLANGAKQDVRLAQ